MNIEHTKKNQPPTRQNVVDLATGQALAGLPFASLSADARRTVVMDRWRDFIAADIAERDAREAVDEKRALARAEAGPSWVGIKAETARGAILVNEHGQTVELTGDDPQELLRTANREIRTRYRAACERHGVPTLGATRNDALQAWQKAAHALLHLPGAAPEAAIVLLALRVGQIKRDPLSVCEMPRNEAIASRGLVAAYEALAAMTGLDPVADAFRAGWRP